MQLVESALKERSPAFKFLASANYWMVWLVKSKQVHLLLHLPPLSSNIISLTDYSIIIQKWNVYRVREEWCGEMKGWLFKLVTVPWAQGMRAKEEARCASFQLTNWKQRGLPFDPVSSPHPETSWSFCSCSLRCRRLQRPSLGCCELGQDHSFHPAPLQSTGNMYKTHWNTECTITAYMYIH